MSIDSEAVMNFKHGVESVRHKCWGTSPEGGPPADRNQYHYFLVILIVSNYL